ncbi:hypothetical protein RO3G_02803 [Lichtheimia corymbifera JMRC:FSU:9682]|uniref:Uncharacterized protein n=1 Tax=Lichtheimia corymbifera JMRC:FSU:9682 TaxID=1263082 RepID=A0A068RIV3_9FUNG|nr:hypothetical protein RO3G_02803 [Lichtheimia corymbifera JMRC:FSU:9682]
MLSFGEFLATFLTFAALVLEIFVLVSGSGNLPVLRSLYFASVEYENKFTRLGLWGSCYGTGDTVDECSTPTVPFNWPEAEGLNVKLSVDLPDSIYLAIFILFWVAFLANAFAMMVTLFTFYRRIPKFILAFVSLMATGALCVIFIMVVVAAARIQDAAGQANINAHIGPSTWMLLGSMVASALATGWYAFQCICRRQRSTTPDAFKY